MTRLTTMPMVAMMMMFAHPRTSAGLRPCESVLASFRADTTIGASQFSASGTSNRPLLSAILKAGPEYPQALREAGKEGSVRTVFVVDTMGRVMMSTAEILRESDPAFGRAVCQFLARAQFSTAVVNGRKISVRVQDQPFEFTLRR